MQLKCLFVTGIAILLSLPCSSFAQEPKLLDHGGGVRTLAFSPVNNQLVASAGESSIIKLWNLRSGKVRTLTGHTDRVNSVAFSPNGRLLVSGSEDWTFRLWNISQQKNITTFETVTDGNRWRTRAVAFSPDGQLLAIGGDRYVKLWDVRARTTITTLRHEQPVWTLAFSHDGQLLAAGEGSNEGTGIVTVWNIQKRQTITQLEGDPKVMRSVKFSPDDRILASSGWDGQLKLWDVLNWKLIGTIPNTGYYEIAFSPDGKMIVSTNDRDVSLWWVEDQARVARLPGPTGWAHPVNFSHDGTYLAVGDEDGIVRIWRIDTSLADDDSGGIQILHVDTYLQQLSDANSANGDNIPEPIPPPAVVRDFFELDPFYEQWINVGGLPVLTSAKVNPYALKEAAWLITKMIGHRSDVLRAMVENKARFSVIGYTEIITEIPEYRNDPRPDFLVYGERGWGGTEGATVSSSEENILSPLDPHSRTYNVLIHEFAHAIHLLGLNTLDPAFDERLQITYEMAMKKGLWRGTYASADRKEYWAESTQAWFHPDGGHSFSRFGSTRQALKEYDPGLAALLTEVYGDSGWRYTPVETRTHLPHLQGFDSQDAPTFEGWPELEALYLQLRTDPSSDGGGKWVNLEQYNPNQLLHLTKSSVPGDTSIIIFVNFTQDDLLLYWVDSDGTEQYWTKVYPWRPRGTSSRTNTIWLVKDTTGKNLAVFRTEEKTGRAFITGNPPPSKITGPWLWMIAPTEAGQGGANSTDVDSLDVASGGAVTEMDVAANGAKEGSTVGNYVWTLGEIAETGGNNVNDLLNKISLGRDNMDDHSSYALITLESLTAQSDVTMSVGSDDAVKVWLNGEVVHNNPINRGADNFQELFNVDLKQGDNLLLVKVSERAGGWSMFVGIDADVNAVYKRPPDPVASVDVNSDGVVNILDLVSVSSNFGKTGQNIADVNGDGIVNIVDLVKVAGEMGAGAAAPAAHPQTLEILTATDVRQWLTQAQNFGLTDITSQRGILILQQLLAALIPKETSLLPNYPNPFNPETWIPYQLSQPAEVTLHIYAVDGRLIRTLALGHQPAGMYHSKNRAVYWDGRNEVGESVASGVYFYTLSTGNFSATRKMLIRK